MSDKDVSAVVELFDKKFEEMRKATNKTLMTFGVIVLIFVFGAGGLYFKVNYLAELVKNNTESQKKVQDEMSSLKVNLASKGIKISE